MKGKLIQCVHVNIMAPLLAVCINTLEQFSIKSEFAFSMRSKEFCFYLEAYKRICLSTFVLAPFYSNLIYEIPAHELVIN